MVKEILPEYRNEPGARPPRHRPERLPGRPALPGRSPGRNLALVLAVVALIGSAIASSWTAGLFNQRPTARLAADRCVLFCGGGVIFDATSSSDPEGSLAHCHWNFGDDFNLVESREMRTVHTYSRPGLFRASVSVEDARGAISEPAYTTVAAVPRPASDAPSAWTFSDLNFSIDVSALAGVPVNFSWAFSDGSPPAAGPSACRQFKDDGQVEATASVSFNGRTAQSSVVVRILNRSPRASMNITPGEPYYSHQELGFDGSASYDPDGTVSRWRWDPGDGSPGGRGGSELRHAYAGPGLYRVELEVTDNDGAASNTTVFLTVLKDPTITGFNASFYRDPGGAARANVTIRFANNGDAKAAGTVNVTVSARAPDGSAIPPACDSSRTNTYTEPVDSGTRGLSITVRELLAYDPSPERTRYYVELCYLGTIVDAGWYQ